MEQSTSPTKEMEENEQPAANSRCSKINVKLLPYKSFYFLFFSAVGSLFPYLAIFYKELWLSAQQTGILIGIRPILQLVSSSAWGIVADKSEKAKYIFLVSLAGWLCANFSLSLVKHSADIGPCRDNGSLTVFDNALRIGTGPIFRNGTDLHRPDEKRLLGLVDRHRTRRKRDFNASKRKTTSFQNAEFNTTENQVISKVKSTFKMEMTERRIEEESSIGHPAWSFDAMLNAKLANDTDNGHHEDDRVFTILLTITIVGTLVAAPAIPFADTATLQALGEDKDFYGKQRQWGALGWGISSFLVGSLVTTVQEKSKCNVPNHVDYTPCFYAFAVLMSLAFIPALFVRFEDRNQPSGNLTGRLRSLINFNSVVFLLTIQQFGNSWGVIQTFLLWHLQDLGGTQFLFSIISAVQCLSEVVAYHVAGYAITKFGHDRVLYIGFLFSSLRFILYSVIKQPWLVVPIEIFHGLSTTLMWALAVSFVGLNAGVATTMQGILSGIHWGLGLGGGAILGGILVNAIGAKYTFLAYGIVSFLNLIGFILSRNLNVCSESQEERQSLLGETAREEVELNSIESKSGPAIQAIH